MLSVFEGQVLNLELIFNKNTSKSHEEIYDFVEIKQKHSKFVFKTPFYRIPSSENEKFEDSYILVINYYKVQKGERTGILKFQELENFQYDKVECLETVVLKVEKPFYYQEFYKGPIKYLIVKPKVKNDFEIIALRGELIKEGPFYRILGEGPYVFKSKDIVFDFK